jgi:hypothetical protein
VPVMGKSKKKKTKVLKNWKGRLVFVQLFCESQYRERFFPKMIWPRKFECDVIGTFAAFERQ